MFKKILSAWECLRIFLHTCLCTLSTLPYILTINFSKPNHYLCTLSSPFSSRHCFHSNCRQPCTCEETYQLYLGAVRRANIDLSTIRPHMIKFTNIVYKDPPVLHSSSPCADYTSPIYTSMEHDQVVTESESYEQITSSTNPYQSHSSIHNPHHHQAAEVHSSCKSLNQRVVLQLDQSCPEGTVQP